MKREFQVIFREMEDAAGDHARRPIGPVLTVNVIADGEDLPRSQFTAKGYEVIAVNEVRPVVDWSKPNFDLDEAGAYCNMKGVSFSKFKGDGQTPWVTIGRGLVPRDVLEKWVKQHGNETAREIADKL
jgi:hypothetical protein